MSDSVPIATEYLTPEEQVEDYMEFQTDSAGQKLRYKILIQNRRILTVLYNTGADIIEIPFVENKLDMKSPMMQATVSDVFGNEPIIINLESIPKTMTCSHDKKLLDDFKLETIDYEPLCHCKMRYFERLPGLVDVGMVSADGCNSLYEGEYKFSLPVC